MMIPDAASGIATRAPWIPPSVPPATAEMTTSEPGTATALFKTRAHQGKENGGKHPIEDRETELPHDVTADSRGNVFGGFGKFCAGWLALAGKWGRRRKGKKSYAKAGYPDAVA